MIEKENMIIHNNLKSKGLIQKFSDKELERVGIQFSDYKLGDNDKAFFFIDQMKQNKNNINLLKKEGFNVTRSKKFIKKSK